MIEINLSPKSKKASLNNIGGLDLSLLNVKMLLLAFIVLYIPEGYIADYFDTQIKSVESFQLNLRKKLRELQAEVRSMEIIEKQANALRDQEIILARKLKVAREVIGKRQNPYQVLQYIAENTPENIWFSYLSVQDRTLVIRGYSKDFSSISKFLESLKSSIFFSNDVFYSSPQTEKKSRFEVFEIKANIVSFK